MGVLVGLTVLWTYNLDSDWAWRPGFVVEGAFAVISIVLILFADESPRWLVSQGRNEEAQSNLERFSIAVLTQIFYQVTGSNTLLSYFPIIIFSAGITDTRMLIIINMCIFGGTFFLTPIGGYLSERVGRRILFLAGTAAMTAALAVLAILGYYGEGGDRVYGICSIAMVVVFQFASSLSWMLLSFSYPLEILKFSQRAKGMAIAQSIGYAFGFLNLYTIPIAIERIGWRYYAANAGWNAAILIIIYFWFKETKGRTLEEIDGVFEKDVDVTGELVVPKKITDCLEKKPSGS
uniref:Major facilitator superfamily (MFS) profile domain-containing protein n=1 Tax=Bionectria ochroleuca TaxID=29856 RepID=A0A0B7K5L1_BIOOC